MGTPTVEINEANLSFVEALYRQYVADRHSVDAEWQAYFDGMPGNHRPAGADGPSFAPRSIFGGPARAAFAGPSASAEGQSSAALAFKVARLIDAFRLRGHLVADTNPIAPAPEAGPEFTLAGHGISTAESAVEVGPTGVAGFENASAQSLIDKLRRTYCGHVSVEMAHIQSGEVREWLAREMENAGGQFQLTQQESVHALRRLTQAEVFENFLHTKFVGAKRFSLEGGEGLIPLLDFVLDEGAQLGLEQAFIGMAHRGRLNVLTHIIRKDPRNIFSEFDDHDPLAHLGSGDVKYHKGARSEITTLSGKPLQVALNFNPSHLEFVYPVVTGRVYALQAKAGPEAQRFFAPIVIHGDASVIGQGVVAETVNMTRLPGYSVGGVIHVVINNQIGFTTPPTESRSSVHCTAVAQIAEAPIFHVQGDDVGAIAWVARTAMRFRKKFGNDVFIDLVCFRKYGHNEGDEPWFTQPQMYGRIKQHPGTRHLWADTLVSRGVINAEVPARLIRETTNALDDGLADVRTGAFSPAKPKLFGAPIWEQYAGGRDATIPDVDTKVPRESLQRLLLSLSNVPAGFEPHRGIKRILQARAQAAEEARELDWGMGESLAFASLLDAGVPVRLDGQDAERGTFSHRHSVLHDQSTGQRYSPLQHLSAEQGIFDVINSPLSEAAVMGFDYGYSREAPEALVIWEAQFGDFANGAQVIIDQFVSAAEDKWSILSGLVLMLPHGFEGQGPEHSSARLERFLALCAQDNLQVCQPTTPAQLFHLLRRQVLRKIRKPLVIMTPKSLLRHKSCVSSLAAFYQGRFQRVIGDRGGDEQRGLPPKAAKRVILCTGKLYYDLAAYRDDQHRDEVAILRLEQLYPMPARELLELLEPYPNGTDLVWVQEEPWNMGAWYYMRARLPHLLGDRFPLRCVSRAESASPATGSKGAHDFEQARLVQEAIDGQPIEAPPEEHPHLGARA